jgi:hypothetical protein
MASRDELLERFYRECCDAGPAGEDERTRDFCFHMTDWANDLEALHRLLEHPEQFTSDQVFDVVYGFLIHASGHIAAAAKLAGVKPVEFEIPAASKAASSKHES